MSRRRIVPSVDLRQRHRRADLFARLQCVYANVVAAVVEAAVSTQPGGFTSGDLAVRVQVRLGVSAEVYQPRQAAYDLKKLRGKMLVRKIGKSRLDEAPAEGLQTLMALGVLRE